MDSIPNPPTQRLVITNISSNWFGISDHKGGVLLLIFTIFLKMGYDSHFRHTAVEVGGPKRLYAMVTVYSAGFLAIFAFPVFFLTEVFIQSFTFFLLLLCLATGCVMIIDFYAEQTCFQHVADPGKNGHDSHL